MLGRGESGGGVTAHLEVDLDFVGRLVDDAGLHPAVETRVVVEGFDQLPAAKRALLDNCVMSRETTKHTHASQLPAKAAHSGEGAGWGGGTGTGTGTSGGDGVQVREPWGATRRQGTTSHSSHWQVQYL